MSLVIFVVLRCCDLLLFVVVNCAEALHGVAGSPGVFFDEVLPYATSFPQVINTGQRSVCWFSF